MSVPLQCRTDRLDRLVSLLACDERNLVMELRSYCLEEWLERARGLRLRAWTVGRRRMGRLAIPAAR
jgi:hypothetical protein